MILLMEKILRQLIGSLSILYKVLYFPSGAGFLPLTVSLLRCASSFSFFSSAFVLSGSTGLHSESTCQRCGHVSCLWVALRVFFFVWKGWGIFVTQKNWERYHFNAEFYFPDTVDCKKATITLWRVRWRRFQRGAGGLKVRFPGDHKVRLQHTKFPLNHGWNVGNLSGMCLTKIMYWYITSGRL